MKYDVYGIGNALVDMEFKIPGEFLSAHNITKGAMELVDQDMQNALLSALESKGHKEIKRACGGSAANTMIAISQFGGQAFYSCKVAQDAFGDFYLKDLKANQVDTKHSYKTAPRGVTGKCMVMVTDDAQRTMCTFLGITASFSYEELDEVALKNSKWLYVEGYLVASPTGQAAAITALEMAKKHNVKTSLTMSDVNMVKFFRNNIDALLETKIDLLFCNEAEAMEFAATSDLSHAREVLKKYAKQFVITLGSNGSIIWDGTMFIDIEPHTVKAIDTNGAGDMFAGAFLYGITHGHTLAGAGTIASLASSKLVTKFGPRLEKRDTQLVLKELFGE